MSGDDTIVEAAMRVLIRADASETIGTGHLMRCLALADRLRRQGAKITFACAKIPADLAHRITAGGFKYLDVSSPTTPMWTGGPEDVLDIAAQLADLAATRQATTGVFDWVIVDHYGLDARWEEETRTWARRLLVLDDLANRPHDCDLLLDQNPGDERHRRYQELSPRHAALLAGPRFALLRSDFAAMRAACSPRAGAIGRVFVMFGGSDPTRETAKAIEALRSVPRVGKAIDVVVGTANPLAAYLRDACARDPRMRFHCGAPNIAELMASADLALGACGTSAWERCAVFLPAIVVAVADNQREIASGLARAGAAEFAGWHADVTMTDLANVLLALDSSPARVKSLSERAGVLVDGRGADRVATAMEELDAHSRVMQ